MQHQRESLQLSLLEQRFLLDFVPKHLNNLLHFVPKHLNTKGTKPPQYTDTYLRNLVCDAPSENLIAIACECLYDVLSDQIRAIAPLGLGSALRGQSVRLQYWHRRRTLGGCGGLGASTAFPASSIGSAATIVSEFEGLSILLSVRR